MKEVFFFFKQKTAYEIKECDWSSDVCSSDLGVNGGEGGWRIGALTLMAEIVSRLCQQRSLLRSRVGELAALYRLTAEFAGQKDLDSLLDMVTSTVVKTLRAKASTIRLFNEGRNELVIRAVANLSSDYLDKGPIILSQSQIDQEVIETLKPVYVADQATDPRVMYPAESAREGLVSLRFLEVQN